MCEYKRERRARAVCRVPKCASNIIPTTNLALFAKTILKRHRKCAQERQENNRADTFSGEFHGKTLFITKRAFKNNTARNMQEWYVLIIHSKSLKNI